MTAEVPNFFCSPGNIAQDNIAFQLQGNGAPEEIIRLDSEGFHYRGQLIEDAGEAHRLMVDFLKQNTRPDPEPPSLKEQALEAQRRMWSGTSNHDDWNLIRRALEQLDD